MGGIRFNVLKSVGRMVSPGSRSVQSRFCNGSINSVNGAEFNQVRRDVGQLGHNYHTANGLKRSEFGSMASAQIFRRSYSSSAPPPLLRMTVSSAQNLTGFWHMYNGIKEIMADYVHQEMTRTWILICLRIFFLVAIKDVFLFLVDPPNPADAVSATAQKAKEAS